MKNEGTPKQQALALAVSLLVMWLAYINTYDLLNCDTAGVAYNALAFIVATVSGMVSALGMALLILKLRD
jgi:hypothetical protein